MVFNTGYGYVSKIVQAKNDMGVNPESIEEYANRLIDEPEDMKNEWFNKVMKTTKQTNIWYLYLSKGFDNVADMDDLVNIEPTRIGEISNFGTAYINSPQKPWISMCSSTGSKRTYLSKEDLANLMFSYGSVLHQAGIEKGDRVIGVTAPQVGDKIYASGLINSFISVGLELKMNRMDISDMASKP